MWMPLENSLLPPEGKSTARLPWTWDKEQTSGLGWCWRLAEQTASMTMRISHPKGAGGTWQKTQTTGIQGLETGTPLLLGTNVIRSHSRGENSVLVFNTHIPGTVSFPVPLLSAAG